MKSNDPCGFLKVPYSNVPHFSTLVLSKKIGSVALNEHKRRKAILQEFAIVTDLLPISEHHFWYLVIGLDLTSGLSYPGYHYGVWI